MASLNRLITLSSGAKHPLLAVSGCLGRLDSYLSDETTRHLVCDLRKLSLGFEVSAKGRADLQSHALVESDGAVHPIMKDVVLAAVRGEGQALYLVSPFTDALDRALSEFVDARDRIRTQLSPEDARQVFDDDVVEKTLATLREDGKRRPGNWTTRLNLKQTPPAGPSELP